MVKFAIEESREKNFAVCSVDVHFTTTLSTTMSGRCSVDVKSILDSASGWKMDFGTARTAILFII